jgi:hypothetical protein
VGKNRVLLLSTDYILAQAEHVEEIYEDGTFKSCPKPFYQLFFIRGRLRGKKAPRLIAAGLLPGADEKNSYDVLHAQLHAATGGRLNAKTIMSDFKKGIGNSARKTWPQIIVSVSSSVGAIMIQLTQCWFHLRQSGYRRLQHDGLAKLLNTDTLYTAGLANYTFDVWIRILYGLAYVPTTSAYKVYKSIVWPEVLDTFLRDYFEGRGNTMLFTAICSELFRNGGWWPLSASTFRNWRLEPI